MSLRDNILNIKRKSVQVNIPGVGEVVLKELTSGELSELMASRNTRTASGAIEAMPETLVLCMYDPETDTPIFTKADVDALKMLPVTVMTQIGEAITDLLGKKPLDDARKNLEPTATGSVSSV